MISIEHLRIKKDIPEIPLITRKFDQIKIANEKIVLDLLLKTKEGKTEEITKTTEFLSKNFNISYERANFIKNSLKSVLINLEKIDLDLLNKRAEDLSVEDFVKLTNLITKNES